MDGQREKTKIKLNWSRRFDTHVPQKGWRKWKAGNLNK